MRKLAVIIGLAVFTVLGIQNTTFATDENQASYWNDKGAHPAQCFKHEANSQGNSSSSHGSSSGSTVTLNTFDQSWPGDHWELLVVKAGPGRNVYQHPSAGVAYGAPEGKTVSHWIVCKGTTPSTTTTTAPETTTTTTVPETTTTLPETTTTVTTIPEVTTTTTLPSTTTTPQTTEPPVTTQPPATTVTTVSVTTEPPVVTTTTVVSTGTAPAPITTICTTGVTNEMGGCEPVGNEIIPVTGAGDGSLTLIVVALTLIGIGAVMLRLSTKR